MSAKIDSVAEIAEELRRARASDDAVSRATEDVVPYTRRVLDALGALRSVVTDQSPTELLESDLQVVRGIVAALIGSEKAQRVIERLPEIRRSIAMDVEAAYEQDPAAPSLGTIIASYPSIMAVSTYRIAHVFYREDEKVVARIMTEDAHSKTGIDINPGATIGEYFFIDHGTGVVIGETCVIGDRVKLYHGVTLAAFSNKRGRADAGKRRHPTIENDVTIYPNATILGGDTVVGRGSVIGGNVWLTETVPAFTRVTVEAPKLQLHKKPLSEFGEGI